ncbi:MAG: monooxygenase [Candidatus Reconcilbacillus cellulovorans]|mgnify:CR=1 FL=1|uniref:Monooxygenase n=1 Tax=Candidatus Reconcilbacillus cellulovorans TaxID=1906605 RepID=A0A2A6E2H2_9BACL|nr:MAG: monooxygenase [Candidatus Reconcilbacillus cellulovorans]
MSRQPHQPVLVVGAGPVGMTAALALRSVGLPAVVLEAEPEGRQRPGSRAIYIHNATLSLLEQISPGLGFAMARRGVTWQVKRTFYRGKEVYVRRYPAPNPDELPAFASLSQVEIERLMYEACRNAGVQFVWNAPVVDVRSDEAGVELATSSGDVWTADYVIGADGARSTVRRSVGIELEGPRSRDFFIVVDVAEDEADPMPIERVFHYEHPAMGGRNVLYVPFAGGWRIDLQLLDGDDPEQFGTVEGVKGWLPNVLHRKYAERITWVSVYQFYQVVASSFTDRHRRVLLAGEAAHLFAPFGARGLNSGVPDALLAARGIRAALEARDAAERARAIEAAAEERRAAACYNRDAAGIALEHMRNDNPYTKLKRELAASLSFLVPKLGRWLDEGPYGPRQGPANVSTKY